MSDVNTLQMTDGPMNKWPLCSHGNSEVTLTAIEDVVGGNRMSSLSVKPLIGQLPGNAQSRSVHHVSSIQYTLLW